MVHRSRGSLRAGRVVFGVLVMGLIVYLVRVGLDDADKVASSIAAVLALVALGAPYLLPSPTNDSPVDIDLAENTGNADATGGGQANTGVDSTDDGRPAQVRQSGDARADGRGTTANSGVWRRSAP